MNHRILGNFITLALILSLTACSSNVMYRSNFTETCNYRQSNDCAENALQVHGLGGENEYRLGFVEYDDQGQLRDRMQMQNVVDEYTKLAHSEDVLLISFVHGWHHSAMPGDGNIKSFRKMLAEVSVMENVGSKQQGRKRRKVIGLYIGWRGDSIIPVVTTCAAPLRRPRAQISTRCTTRLVRRSSAITISPASGHGQQQVPGTRCTGCRGFTRGALRR